MGEHGRAIVNVTSVAGLLAALGIGFNGASKVMLLHLTTELAVELRPSIRLNAVAPAGEDRVRDHLAPAPGTIDRR
jgi:3-oxoacyl-[acyl-carrier protein] reductase